jgi:hypothetical protein
MKNAFLIAIQCTTLSAPIVLLSEVDSLALPKTNSVLSCVCSCKGINSGTVVTKSFAWSGTRQGCQDYSGSWCNVSSKESGKLDNCDTMVDVDKFNGPIVLPPRVPSGGSIRQQPQ